MDWHTLIQLSNGKELHVFLVMAPEDVVSPQWIALATNTSAPTVSSALKRLTGWLLVDRLTTQKYRLSRPGRTLAMQIAAVMETAYDKQLSTGYPQDIHRYVLESVGLRLETENSFGFPEEPKNLLGSSHSSSGLSINESLSLTQPLPPQGKTQKSFLVSGEHQAEAERLADVLCRRVMATRADAVAAITERLELGESAATIELHILLWCAYCQNGAGKRGISAPGRWIVKQLREGEVAAVSERETLANASAGWGEQHPDLARVDELLEKLTVTESGNEQE